jgi:hypothetical protein
VEIGFGRTAANVLAVPSAKLIDEISILSQCAAVRSSSARLNWSTIVFARAAHSSAL